MRTNSSRWTACAALAYAIAVTGGANAATPVPATAPARASAAHTGATTSARTRPAHAARAPRPGGAAPRTTTVERAGPAASAARDSGDDVLRGGSEGTVFKSLTVEGEDRVHLDFDRPDLVLDLDPAKAPGLDWGTARDVLDRTLPDVTTPLLATSAAEPSPYLAKPWLHAFATGPVARFTPDVRGVDGWKLTVADARGQAVTTFEGHGEPPRSIDWDGRTKDGRPVTPGLTYSYVFEARDRAGNHRHFVGRGFSVAAYRLDSPAGATLLFSGRELSGSGGVPPIVLETASWTNQSARTTGPIEVRATARGYDQAMALARSVTEMLRPLVLGDPARVRAVADVQPDAPEDGTLAIGPGR